MLPMKQDQMLMKNCSIDLTQMTDMYKLAKSIETRFELSV